MNFLRSWNLVFLVGFVVYIGIRHVYARRTLGLEKEMSRSDRADARLLVAVFVGSLLLPVLYLFTPALFFADYGLPPLASWCGAVLMMASLWLFWRSHDDLGQNWSITLQLRKEHELVTEGVYRRVRHPMYAAIWLWCIAQGLLLQNWLAGWSALVTFAPLYFRRVHREEDMMCAFFGSQYREYMRRTGRLIPRIGTRAFPDTAKKADGAPPSH